MKPRFTPCFSLNLSLYLLRRAMIWLISTSLKVVSMAVVFFASTSRRETVFRRLLIFSLLSSRPNNALPGTRPGLFSASSTSCLTIFPFAPEGVMELLSTFLSAMIAAATGVLLHLSQYVLPVPATHRTVCSDQFGRSFCF